MEDLKKKFVVQTKQTTFKMYQIEAKDEKDAQERGARDGQFISAESTKEEFDRVIPLHK